MRDFDETIENVTEDQIVETTEARPESAEVGKAGWALLWLLGVPLPLLLVVYLISRAC